MNTVRLEVEGREDRGVIREVTPPSGYIGYVAVDAQGEAIGFSRMRKELYTPEREAQKVNDLWAELEEWEARTLPSSLPVSGSFGLRLLD